MKVYLLQTVRIIFFLFSSGCGGTINADVPGVITSPNYPNFYSHSSRCIWVLRATPGRKVTMTITNFDVEQQASCDYDYLEVRQGATSNSSLVGRYCGSSLPPAITSFGNELYVMFVSDISTAMHGFRAQYTTATASKCALNSEMPPTDHLSKN